jgi:hypothetical protein
MSISSSYPFFGGRYEEKNPIAVYSLLLLYLLRLFLYYPVFVFSLSPSKEYPYPIMWSANDLTLDPDAAA